MNGTELYQREADDLPVTAVIVGAGHRSLIYASYALEHPEELRIVGVVDPDETRRRSTAARFGFPMEHAFASVEQLVAGPRLADAAINGTMDQLHIPTSLPLLQAGYDLLLEKPIGVNESEVLSLYEAARAYGRKVMICHVLRYAPFYAEIRRQLELGAIGDIVAIQTEENVSYHHMATAFVRGKWNSQERCGSAMLLAKCCHDLDLIAWLKGGVRPVRTSSFGSRMQFREANAPAGAGTRCLVDCPLEAECAYSAGRMYMKQQLWGDYVWDFPGLKDDASEEAKLHSLRTDNPYGRCVWRCDNDVVDHQAVIVEFADGSTASHSLNGATAKPCRTIHILGTKGEINGTLEDGYFTIRRPDEAELFKEECIDLAVSSDMHGGGDLRLVADFVRSLRGEAPSLSSTSLDQSLFGHQIGFAAERSRLTGSVAVIDEL